MNEWSVNGPQPDIGPAQYGERFSGLHIIIQLGFAGFAIASVVLLASTDIENKTRNKNYLI